MRRTIYVIDPVCPKFYDENTLKNEGMGASESYLIYNLKEIIGHEKVSNFQIIFFQDTRQEKLQIDGGDNNSIIFEPLNMILEYENLNPETIILQRDPKLFTYLKRIYPKSNLILYCHDFFEGGPLQSLDSKQLREIVEMDVKFLCVSRWHVLNILDNLKLHKIHVDEVKIDFVYFSFNEKIIKKERNPYKLCYFSGHHKGLRQALTIFKKLHEIDNKYEFIVASPTYSEYEIENTGGITFKYNLTREKVLEEISSSLCVLHPNQEYPETFGCVNMEANALGIPVLCYPYGATTEIMKDRIQFIESKNYLHDPYDMRAIIEKILKWNKKMPIIKDTYPELKTKNVIEKWLNLLMITS
jgi:glycosyltransferase involved in cell wall biosynthesis